MFNARDIYLAKNPSYDVDPRDNIINNVIAYSTVGQRVSYVISTKGSHSRFENIVADSGYYSTAPIHNQVETSAYADAGKFNVIEGNVESTSTKSVFTSNIKSVFGKIKWVSGTTFEWDSVYPSSGVEGISLVWSAVNNRIEAVVPSGMFSTPLVLKLTATWPGTLVSGRSGSPNDFVITFTNPTTGAVMTSPDGTFTPYVEILGR